ncbi:PP2C family protein-serine/threonine phosphatase [Streptomyces sp. NPDC058953]|uniref:PP2C family protein-serine/threonine phosphatase n=1 Tax=unclassified Streptomyces TaxID=2593676 RepID=UPI00368AE36D
MLAGARTASGAPVGDGARPAARLAADLAALHELTRRLATTDSLDTAVDEVLRAGAALVGARRGLAVIEPPPAAARTFPASLTRGYGLSHAELGQIETVPRALTAYGRILDRTERRDPATGPGAGSGSGPLPLSLPEVSPECPRPATGVPEWFPAAAPGPGTYPLPSAVSHPDILGDESLDPLRRAVAVRLGCAAAYTQPLASGTAGTLGAAVWLYDEPAAPAAHRRELVERYAGYATEHLSRLIELEEARRNVATMAEELLPTRLPRIPGVRLAVRHRRGPGGPRGDWYDALPLPEGALGLAVGSVGGTGPGALAAVGRLRASLRAYAVMEGEDPVAVLSDLELLLRLTEPARTATALFAYAEPAAGKMVLAGAGHTPPLLVGERRTEFVETSLSAPLGMLACWEAPSVELCPEPGETVLLYTDGLLRLTGDPMDRAFARLHAAAASVPRAIRDDPGAVADHVLNTLLPEPAGPYGTGPETARTGPEATRTAGDFHDDRDSRGTRSPAGRGGDRADDVVMLAVRFG